MNTSLQTDRLQTLFQMLQTTPPADYESVNSLQEVKLLRKKEWADVELARERSKAFKTQQEHFDYILKNCLWYVECCEKGLYAA